jgi:hypothetical protein
MRTHAEEVALMNATALADEQARKRAKDALKAHRPSRPRSASPGPFWGRLCGFSGCGLLFAVGAFGYLYTRL